MSQINAINEWEQVKLSDIAEITSGGTPLRKEPKYWNGYIPWVKTGEINGKLIKEDDIEEFITEEGLKKSSTKMIPSGSILMAMYGQGQTRGRVAKLGLDATINQACAAIILKDIADTDFIFQQLLFSYDNIRDLSNDGGQKNLSSSLIKSLKVFLAPLPEQQKIAEILSTWDEAIEKLESLIELKGKSFQYLRKKVLKSQEVELVELGSLFEIRIGGTPSRKTPEYWDELKLTSNKWLSIRDMDRKYLSDSKEHLSDLGVKKSNVKLIKKNTLVLSFKLSLGRVGILKKDFYTNEAIAALVPNTENLDQEFYYYILQTVNYDQYVDVAAKGKTLNKQKLQDDVLVPYCDYNSQKQIGQLLNTIDSEIQDLISLRNYVQQQKQGLMQKLLTGKVRVKL